MSKISAGVRSKRFRVKAGHTVNLIIETELGDQLTLQVIDASLSGIGATVASDARVPGLESGRILPESKLSWGGSEVSLGRLVIRRAENKDGTLIFGFHCIDMKVPILDRLSKEFDQLANGAESALSFELGARKFNIGSFIEADHSHSDLFHKCHEYHLLLADNYKNPMYQFYAIRHKVDGTRVQLTTRSIKKPSEFVSFGNYDYFGFSNNLEVKEAAIRAIEQYGLSATATPPLSGRTLVHEQLEDRIAKILRKEAVTLFTSGFAANIGALSALLTPSDLAVADIGVHASIHDGLSAGKAKTRFFRHNRNIHLDTLLTEHRGNHSGALALTEGLYSMDGDVPDLVEFIQVAKKHGARTFIDEVHSFGIMGPDGRGAAERAGVLDDFDIYVGSLSKGIGSGGGFVAGSKELASWFRGFGRSSIFSSALSPAMAAGSLKAIELLERDPSLRVNLISNLKSFKEGLKKLGYNAISDDESPIIPVIIGDDVKLGQMNKILLDHGVFVNTVIYPAVSLETCRFRFSISAAHSKSDLQLALVALKAAFESVGFQGSSGQSGNHSGNQVPSENRQKAA